MRRSVVKANRYIEELLRLSLRRATAGEAELRFARSVTGSFFLRVIATVIAFLTSLLLARCLGVEGYGVYTYVAAWVLLLTVPSNLGFDRLLVRQVAVYASRAEWNNLRGLLRRAHQVSLSTSLSLSVLVGIVIWWAFDIRNAEMRATFWVALLSLPLLALINLRQAAAQGIRRIVHGQLPELLIRPVLFFLAVIAAYAIFGASLSAAQVMAAHLFVSAVTFLIGAHLIRRILPLSIRKARAAYRMREWIGQASLLLLISGLSITNAQIVTLTLGALQGTYAVGIYSVAGRAAELISFPLVALNATLAPNVVRLWAANDTERLQHVLTKCVQFDVV